MSLEGIVIGLLGIVLGAAFCFGGFRWFLILLPIWGLFAGFMAGAGATSVLLGEGFLASALGFVVGIVVAIVFALLSWFYWWGAVLVVAGWFGYTLAHFLLVAIGFNGEGWLTILISIVAGAAVALVAFLANAPKYVAIILTAFAGAAWLTAGIALIPGIIKTADLETSPLVAIYQQGWIWIVIWAVVGAVGIAAQLQMTARWQGDLVASYSERSPF
jgi:Domain of unknown function (DUF4203)